MSNWIDAKDYLGWCRRSGGERFRWSERRRADASSQPPSLEAMLRRLRVQSVSVDTAESRVSFQSYLNATIELALARGAHGCARELDDLATLLRNWSLPTGLSPIVDRRLVAAHDRAKSELET